MSKTRARATKARFAKWKSPTHGTVIDTRGAHAAPGSAESKARLAAGLCACCGVTLTSKISMLTGKVLGGLCRNEKCPLSVERLRQSKTTIPVAENDKASEGLKFDAGKPPLELISEKALLEVAKVLAYGAKKYAPDNWRQGMAWRRLIGAAKRHLGAFNDGEDRDPETGLPHMAHLICCAMFLLEYQLTGNGTDDRWKGKK